MSVPVTGSCGRENHTLCTQAWCECDCHTAYRRPNMRYPSISDLQETARSIIDAEDSYGEN